MRTFLDTAAAARSCRCNVLRTHAVAYRTAVTLYTYTRHLAISLLCDEPSLANRPLLKAGIGACIALVENVRMCNFFSATIGCTGCSSPRAKGSGQGMTMESSAARKMQTYPIPISPSCFPSRLLLSPDADCPPLLNGTFHPSRSTALPASIAVYSCTSAARSQGPAITPRTSTTPASRIVHRASCIVHRTTHRRLHNRGWKRRLNGDVGRNRAKEWIGEGDGEGEGKGEGERHCNGTSGGLAVLASPRARGSNHDQGTLVVIFPDGGWSWGWDI